MRGLRSEFRAVFFGEKGDEETERVLDYLEQKGIKRCYYPVFDSKKFLAIRSGADRLPLVEIIEHPVNPPLCGTSREILPRLEKIRASYRNQVGLIPQNSN